MKVPFKKLAAAAATVSIAGSALGASIGANWVNNNNGGVQNSAADSLGTSETAGAPGYTQNNWNNLGRWGNPTTLNDSLGNSSGVDITWDASTTANVGATTTPNGKLMFGFAGATGVANVDGPPYNGFTGANQPDARVRGLTSWLAARGASSYSVVLYVDGGRTDGSISEHWLQAIATDGDFGGGITLDTNLTPHIFVSDTANFSGTFTPVPLTADSLGAAAAGNYIVFTNLSADMFILRSEDTHATYAPVSGIQIVPEYTVPHIDVQPSQTPPGALFQGQSFGLTVVAAGPALNYQWRKDNVNLSNQTNTTFSASNITVGDSGNYDVVVANSFGSVTSSVVVISISGDAPPSGAVVAPASLTRGVGGQATFNVAVNGSTPFTYQWKKGGVSMAGQTNASLVLNNLTLGDAGSYTCGITNSFGGTLSSAGALTVNAVAGTAVGLNFMRSGQFAVTAPALGIDTANWNNLTGINDGRTGTQAVSSLTVTWSSANTWSQGFGSPAGDAEVFYGYLDDGGGGNTVTISGLTSLYGAYVVQALGATDNGVGLFDVTITNGPQALTYAVTLPASGPLSGPSSVSAPLYDDVIKLTGIQGDSGGTRGGLAGLIITDKPVIATQPQGPASTLYSGYPLNLTGLSVVGVPTLSYQWRKNGSNIANATNAVYTDALATSGDSGDYDVIVANTYGSVTSSIVSVTIVDSAPFNAVVDPVVATYSVGGTISFTVTAEGSVPFTYQWYQDATLLTGQTNASLTLTNLQLAQAANYTCAVTNTFGGTISSAGTLFVNAVPPATVGINFTTLGEAVTATAFGVDMTNWTGMQGANNTIVINGPITVTCAAANMWQQGDLTPAGNNEVFFSYLDDGGSGASVTFSGLASVFPVYVVQTLGATDNGSGLQNVTINGSETLTYPSPQPSPQLNGDPGLIGQSTQSSALYGDTLTIQGMQGFSGQLRGGIAGVIITDQPVLENQPQAPTNTIYVGSTFSITGLNVIGVPTLSYQWRKDGTNLIGATSAVYTKANATVADEGDYEVVITNAFGSVTSSIVAISGIVPLPVITITPAGGNLNLEWSSGTLLEATNVLGPWTTNTATSPYVVTPTEPQKYFRLLLQ